MAKTRTDLANRALDKLLLVGSGQSPDAEDTAKADGVIDSFSEFISAIDIYTIADLEDIDLVAFEFLADYLAWFIAPDFGKPQDDNVAKRAEYMLQRITASTPTYKPQTAEHF
jgi:hypothetical protein